MRGLQLGLPEKAMPGREKPQVQMARRLDDVATVRGTPCAMWQWTPASGPPVALVVIFHGLGGHARFPSVRIAAELLTASGFAVCGMDLPGHGASPGMHGYIDSAASLVDDGLAAFRAASAAHPGLPVFLLGSSMGGAIAVQVAARAAEEARLPEPWGLVLMAPMLAPAVAPPLARLVSLLSWTPLARLALIGSSATSNEKQYADPDLRREIDEDTLAYKGKLRVASVAAVLDLGTQTEAALPTVRAPFLCCVADDEQVLGPASRAAQERLMEVAATPKDRRTFKSYAALHGLLCELPEKRAQIAGDIVDWLLAAVKVGVKAEV